MQVMDEKKRIKILSVAAEKFASQPFHKVLLSKVAEAAGVGKGTLYTYFKSKDDLYLSVLYSGFTRLLERLRNQMNESPRNSLGTLEMAIGQMVQFAYENPHLFELMRTSSLQETFSSSHWGGRRMELKSLLESIIRKGIRQGELTDAHPELTARFIPGLVRSVMIDAAPSVDRKTLTAHIFHFVKAALAKEK
jgi:AcrR family transcriptional regulator